MSSQPGEKSVDHIAADANVILSAIIGKAALKVFIDTDINVITTSSVLDEVREYVPHMAKLYDLAPEVLEAQLRLLPITEYTRDEYKKHLAEAARRIAQRDPDDVDLLALALSRQVPVWSNDNDFKAADVEWYTTAKLLRLITRG